MDKKLDICKHQTLLIRFTNQSGWDASPIAPPFFPFFNNSGAMKGSLPPAATVTSHINLLRSSSFLIARLMCFG